jgi:5-methylcytosine-specific restriction endonuclease McrA
MFNSILKYFSLVTLKELAKYKEENDFFRKEIKIIQSDLDKSKVAYIFVRNISKRRSHLIESLKKENLFLLCQNIKKLDQNKLKNFSFEIRKIGKCDICHSSEKLTAHHLWSKVLFPQLAYQFANGVCLCELCHNIFHKKYKKPIQVRPDNYLKLKTVLQNDITLYGKINYSNY